MTNQRIKPVRAPEVAERLGLSLDQFYRRREALHAAGLPRPVLPVGKLAWDRATIEAWFGRHHPNAPPMREVANDTTAPVPSEMIALDEQRRFLAEHYAARARKAREPDAGE